MRRVNERLPVCALCGCAGKKKGGIKSEFNPRVFYKRFYVCTNKDCLSSKRPQSLNAFEGSTRAFGDR